jgi:chromosome segregation ATPase
MHERKKDEHENLLQALREMQSESATKDRIGKLYFIIMLSRWQEAAVNKKYCHVLSDVKSLRGEILSSEALNNEIQKNYNASLDQLNERQAQIKRLEETCEELKSTFITQNKADELARKYQNLCDDRTDLEIELLKAREKLHEEQDKIEGLTVSKLTAERLY